MELEDAFFDTSDYEPTGTKLGEGSYGKVFLVKNTNDDQVYAAKIINIEGDYSGKEQIKLIHEAAILHRLDHPAIVKFIGINFHALDDPSQFSPTILTEYLSQGSFTDVLKKAECGLADHDWNATKKHICLLGIADAMRYLHKKGILHRDLKPENILIDGDYRPRVADFGLSRCFSQALSRSVQLSMTRKIGTPLYMAPELFEDEGHFSTGVDVYAFAILAYEIASGQEPYKEKGKSITFANLVRKVLNNERPKLVDGITDSMWDLITRCWNKEASERPSFDEIFYELSTNFSLLNEDVDEDEIREYLDYLEDGRKEETTSSERKEDFHEEYDQLVKKQEEERKCYSEMFIKLVERQNNIADLDFDSVKGNILHLACKSGNIELAKIKTFLFLFALNDISNSEIEDIYKKLHENKKLAVGKHIKFSDQVIKLICKKSIEIIKQDPTLLQVKAPVNIVGSIHGNFQDALKYVELGGNPAEKRYLFLGNYVDKGENSIETLLLVLCLKILYPANVFLLRGDHETEENSFIYGFHDECIAFYDEEIWNNFVEVFSYLPLAAVISQKIFCVHGGISQQMKTPSIIKDIKRPIKEIKEGSLIFDLLTSNPDPEINNYQISSVDHDYNNYDSITDFGSEAVDSFLNNNDYDLIVRSHQVVPDGYEFPFYPKPTLVTVFSASNYNDYENNGAMLAINEKLNCSFQFVLSPE